MLQYPTIGSSTRSGQLIQAVAQQPRGHPPPARNPLPAARKAPPARAAYNPNKPILGADTVQEQAPSPAAGNISYGAYTDPAIAQMAALAAKAAAIAARSRQEAQSEADAKTKEATIQYGDASGVPGVDAATAQQAAANPFSMLAALQRGYTTGTADLEEGLNKNNLFYGGYRGQQLGQAATDYQQQRYEAGTRYQATLSDIRSALAQALLNADMMDMQYGGAGSDGGGVDPATGRGYDSPERGARPGEWADLPVRVGWNPAKNSDAEYDMSGAVRQPDGTYIGPEGARYDENGRRI